MDSLKQLQASCLALEDKAGIHKTIEKARDGRLFPLGATGEDTSSEEYFADEHDHFRNKLREAYFSVSDFDLRKELIVTQREIENLIKRNFDAEITSAITAVSNAEIKAQNRPWVTASLIATSSVAIGASFSGFTGAIAGAIGGFFFGQGVLANAKQTAITELNQAIAQLENAKTERVQRSLWPEYFSKNEELTGQRENDLDQQSAYANVLKAMTRNSKY